MISSRSFRVSENKWLMSIDSVARALQHGLHQDLPHLLGAMHLLPRGLVRFATHPLPTQANTKCPSDLSATQGSGRDRACPRVKDVPTVRMVCHFNILYSPNHPSHPFPEEVPPAVRAGDIVVDITDTAEGLPSSRARWSGRSKVASADVSERDVHHALSRNDGHDNGSNPANKLPMSRNGHFGSNDAVPAPYRGAAQGRFPALWNRNGQPMGTIPRKTRWFGHF